MPSSIKTVFFELVPSSSTFKEPRLLGIVPSSTTVTPEEATFYPSKLENAELFFLLKSPSSP